MASMDELNALASGGSAGLQAYRNAQTATNSNLQGALNDLSSPSTNPAYAGYNYSATAGKPATSALDSYITDAQQPMVDLANQGVTDATAQQGYENQAINGYLASNNAGLAEKQREFAGNLALQQEKDGLNANNQSSPSAQFALLPQSVQDAYVQGLGTAMQAQDAGNVAANQGAAQATAAAAAPIAATQQDGSGLSAVMRAESREGFSPTTTAAARPAMATTSTTPVGLGPAISPVNLAPNAQQLAQQAAQRQALQSVVAAHNTAMNAPFGGQNYAGQSIAANNYVQAAPGLLRSINTQPGAYQQQAATAFGMNPLEAAGLYPNDPASQLAAGKAYDAQQLYGNPDEPGTTAGNTALGSLNTGDKDERTALLSDLGQSANLDPSEVNHISKVANIAPEQLGKIFSGQAWQQSAPTINQFTNGTPFFPGTKNAIPPSQRWNQFVTALNSQSGWKQSEKQAIEAYARQQFSDAGLSTHLSDS